MVKRKNIRTKGKLSLSRYFQELKKGDKVSVIKELSVASDFPARLQGSTGVVESKRGNAYVLKINSQGKEKTYIIEPVHLKKIKEKIIK